TYSQYVARLDLDTGHIRHFSGGGGTPEAQRVLALLAESGAVWVGTPLGLERMDPATGARRRLMVLDDPAGARQALARGPDGAIWYATVQGLYRIGADGSSRQMDDAPGLSLLATPAGDLWVGGQDGLWRVRGDGSLVHAWPTDPSSDAGAVNGLAVAPDGAIWFAASPFGLRRLDPATGEVRALRHDQAMDGSLPEDTVNTLFVDQAGNLWIGGQYHGLAVTDPAGARFRYLADSQRRSEDGTMMDSSVRSIFQDREGGLWLGTDDGRLLRHVGGEAYGGITDLLAEATGTRNLRVMGFAD